MNCFSNSLGRRARRSDRELFSISRSLCHDIRKMSGLSIQENELRLAITMGEIIDLPKEI